MGDSIIYAVKVSLAVAAGLAFYVILQTLINTIAVFAFGNVVFEIFALVSMFLPFNALAVMLSLSASITAILAFLIGKKIYEFYLNTMSNT